MPPIRYLGESVKPVWPAVTAQQWVLEVGGVHPKWGHGFIKAGLKALEAAEVGSSTPSAR